LLAFVAAKDATLQISQLKLSPQNCEIRESFLPGKFSAIRVVYHNNVQQILWHSCWKEPG